MRNYLSIRQPHYHFDVTHPRTFFHFIILEPSPPIFVAATLIYGLATFVYCASRKTDLYREWFLVIGALGTTAVGFATESTVVEALLGMIPLALLSALVLCTASNAAWRCFVEKRSLTLQSDGVGGAHCIDVDRTSFEYLV